jgi:hypothetical protein
MMKISGLGLASFHIFISLAMNGQESIYSYKTTGTDKHW